MAAISTETHIALLEEKQKAMEAHLQATDRDIVEANALILALQAERTSALKWGILTLGAAVLAMGSWIFNFLMGHVK